MRESRSPRTMATPRIWLDLDLTLLANRTEGAHRACTSSLQWTVTVRDNVCSLLLPVSILIQPSLVALILPLQRSEVLGEDRCKKRAYKLG